jgi:hypothetical protein
MNKKGLTFALGMQNSEGIVGLMYSFLVIRILAEYSAGTEAEPEGL